MPDAVVVGSGPNGLAAAITMARAGRSVLVLERAETVGGGTRSAELTGPGFLHDVCSAIHPLVAGSPFFSELPLAEHGLELVHPDVLLAHPLDDGSAVLLERSVAATAVGLGTDGPAYRKLIEPLVREQDRLVPVLLGPRPFPRHPIRAALLGHAYGWPMARGGSQAIADALFSYLRSLDGEVETGRPVASVDELPPSVVTLLDLTPQGVIGVAGHWLPDRYLRALRRYRYGPGVFKLDWALDGPVPWTAEECARAGTLHIGGTAAEIVESEDAVWRGQASERPYMIVAQQSLFDETRAPAGRHALWAYCHVPNGSTVDMTERMEAQIERFAPGFRDLILARHAMSPADVEARNPNLVGGDINGGVQDLRQLFTRPGARLNPYTSPLRDVFLYSSSTPPGGGVHGMCGLHAARSALRGLAA